MTTPAIAVITPTRGRPDALLRAAASVAAQRDVAARHVIIGDDCPALADPAFVRRLTTEFPRTTVRNVTPASHPGLHTDYRWARVARLRNLGIGLCDEPYIAHLDDDNSWDPDHLGSLVATLEATPGAEVVHSWRRLLRRDGRPYVIPPGTDPWSDDPVTGAKAYALLARAGVVAPGSNVLRDRLKWNDTIIARVDTNEYLVRRELHERIPFAEEFSRWKQRIGLAEDVVFGHTLLRRGVVVACTERVTVNYFMGGGSNG